MDDREHEKQLNWRCLIVVRVWKLTRTACFSLLMLSFISTIQVIIITRAEIFVGSTGRAAVRLLSGRKMILTKINCLWYLCISTVVNLNSKLGLLEFHQSNPASNTNSRTAYSSSKNTYNPATAIQSIWNIRYGLGRFHKNRLTNSTMTSICTPISEAKALHIAILRDTFGTDRCTPNK